MPRDRRVDDIRCTRPPHRHSSPPPGRSPSQTPEAPGMPTPARVVSGAPSRCASGRSSALPLPWSRAFGKTVNDHREGGHGGAPALRLARQRSRTAQRDRTRHDRHHRVTSRDRPSGREGVVPTAEFEARRGRGPRPFVRCSTSWPGVCAVPGDRRTAGHDVHNARGRSFTCTSEGSSPISSAGSKAVRANGDHLRGHVRERRLELDPFAARSSRGSAVYFFEMTVRRIASAP